MNIVPPMSNDCYGPFFDDCNHELLTLHRTLSQQAQQNIKIITLMRLFCFVGLLSRYRNYYYYAAVWKGCFRIECLNLRRG